MGARAVRPPEPLNGPVRLLIHWAFKMPQRRRKCRTKKECLEVPCIVRPDLDNAAKAVIDCLVAAGWFTNDSIVSVLMLCKTEGDNPRLDIQAEDDA